MLILVRERMVQFRIGDAAFVMGGGEGEEGGLPAREVEERPRLGGAAARSPRRIGRSGGRSVRVLACVAAGAALAQKVPALVEREPDLLETAAIVVGPCRPTQAPELVLLGDELFDGYVNLRFVHEPVSQVSQGADDAAREEAGEGDDSPRPPGVTGGGSAYCSLTTTFVRSI